MVQFSQQLQAPQITTNYNKTPQKCRSATVVSIFDLYDQRRGSLSSNGTQVHENKVNISHR